MDQDFERLSVMRGAPPKIVLIDAHNARNSAIAALLVSRLDIVTGFAADPDAAILVLRILV